MRPVKAGKSMRMSYSRQKEVLEMPNLIEVQKDSYQWFLDEGLKEVFDDISPIADYNGTIYRQTMFAEFEKFMGGNLLTLLYAKMMSSILLKNVRKEMLHMQHL